MIITTAAHFVAEAGVRSMRTNGETRSGVSKKHSHLKKTSINQIVLKQTNIPSCRYHTIASVFYFKAYAFMQSRMVCYTVKP